MSDCTSFTVIGITLFCLLHVSGVIWCRPIYCDIFISCVYMLGYHNIIIFQISCLCNLLCIVLSFICILASKVNCIIIHVYCHCFLTCSSKHEEFREKFPINYLLSVYVSHFKADNIYNAFKSFENG